MSGQHCLQCTGAAYNAENLPSNNRRAPHFQLMKVLDFQELKLYIL